MDLSDMHVICNNGGALEEYRTLTKAKGANDIANTDVLHIANFIPPAQYSELQAINAVFGLSQAIRLWHIDQINQAAGRNLGYRYTGQRHLLVLQSSIWEILEDDLKALLRLPLDLVETSQKRRDRYHSRKRALLDRLAAEALDIEHPRPADPEREVALFSVLDKRIDLEWEKLFGQEEVSHREFIFK
ncbi:MAG: hypothetical protein AAGA71_19260 [Pseudomonadota bacterium]